MVKFKCPNCNKPMYLSGCGKYLLSDNNSYYDKWLCEDCSHIVVLDWRR